MKELTKEDKARRYDEVSKEVKDFFEGRRKMQSDVTQTLEYLFPELEESDDERIRKKLLKMLNDMERDESILDEYGLDKLKTIAWLEKQESVEEIVERSKTSWFNAGKIQGKMEGLSDDEKYQQGWHDAIENQGEQKPVEWGEEDENEFNHILKILNLVAEEQETKGYNNLISSVNWLKSIKDRIQSKQSNKPQGKTAIEAIEEENVDKPFDYENGNIVQKDFAPKFEVGDWIVQENIGVYRVIEVCECWYEVVDNKDKVYSIGFDKEYMLRHWTIQDAKDGDVLISWTNKPFIYNGFYNETYVGAYCGLNTFNRIIIADKQDHLHHNWTINKDIRPATKEQRDLLFQKMKEAGYSWDAEKKELKKNETKFHEGDWVIGVATEFKPRQIVEVLTSGYKTTNGGWIGLSFECGMHLWTIEDAKDGDVLVASDGSIFIFAGVVDCACKYYITLTAANDVKINKEKKGGYWETSRAVYPATKEQCALLFQKMREEGYEWNNEKKEVIRRI